MKPTPIDIKRQQFKTVFRGFDPNEVSAYLGIVSSEIEELLKQVKDVTQRNIELETQLKDYKSIEKAMQDTFMQAQETTGKAIENARKEAELVIKDAELKATQIVDKARSDLIAIKEHITILKAKKDAIVSRLKMLLKSELELITTLGIDEELQEGVRENNQELIKKREEIEEVIKNLDKQV